MASFSVATRSGSLANLANDYDDACELKTVKLGLCLDLSKTREVSPSDFQIHDSVMHLSKEQ